MLADMAMKIEAARCLVLKVADLVGKREGRMSSYSAMAKAFASDVAMQVTTDAVQVMGGYGYIRDFPAENICGTPRLCRFTRAPTRFSCLVIAGDIAKEKSKELMSQGRRN